MHPGMQWRSILPGMAIDASRDGDHCIQGWRSRDDRRCIQGSMAIAVSLDGYRFHPGMALGMAIAASLDGDRCIPGW